jgi:D-sedoheptulose 7-phosphate isomerase
MSALLDGVAHAAPGAATADPWLDAWHAHMRTFEAVRGLRGAVQAAADCVVNALRNGNKLMLCGNGGSAADCQHIASELTGRFVTERRPLAALALTTDSSALTSIGNDYSFDAVFERQLRGLGRPGDCLIAISTSGNSANVLNAVMAARELDIACVGLLGRDGGAIAPLCHAPIVVPGAATARIQEAHIFIGHLLCGLVEQGLGLA